MKSHGLVNGTFILFLLFTGRIAVAQAKTEAVEYPASGFDTAYLQDYTGLLTTRVFLLFQNATVLLNPPGDKIDKIVYRPNANVKIGIAAFWKWFGLGVSIDNPFYNTDRQEYGKTTAIDLRVNAFGRAFAGELFLQQYKGFYISSPEKPGGSHYIMPDMKTLSIGISGYWIYNAGRFSIRAAFIQNERQKKSAGSFVVRPSFLYYQITSQTGIIPHEISNAYDIPSSSLFTSGEFYSIGLSPGYVYTLVFLRNFYVTAAAFPGIAAQYASFRAEHNELYNFEFTFQLNGRIAFGYNSDKWFLGASVQTGFNEIPDKLNNALSTYTIAQIRLWGGMRFNLSAKKKIHAQ